MIDKTGYWQAKDGRVLAISDMSTSHIQNCIALIERAAHERRQQHDEIPWNHDSLSEAQYAALEEKELRVAIAQLCAKKSELEQELQNRTNVSKYSLVKQIKAHCPNCDGVVHLLSLLDDPTCKTAPAFCICFNGCKWIGEIGVGPVKPERNE